jgi:hypothetical protein
LKSVDSLTTPLWKPEDLDTMIFISVKSRLIQGTSAQIFLEKKKKKKTGHSSVTSQRFRSWLHTLDVLLWCL